jgi:predicted nuclease of restriction endonuclease-like (RecB) superfamily
MSKFISERKVKSFPRQLYSDVKLLIDEARNFTAQTVNSVLSMLYWNIGNRINSDILKNGRAEYGKNVIAALSKKLEADYGGSFSEKNIRRMSQFAQVFPRKKIVVSLIRQLSWTHFIALIPIEDSLKRNFYIQMCIKEHWSVRTFRERINSMLYERTAISQKPEKTIQNDIKIFENEDKMSPDLAFRDPYFLDFLGLSGKYSERDLENAIIAELQNFIIEFGTDFAFLARQKRITVDNRDYYIDLLFFHRRLKRLIAIDLKIGEFDAAYKGQMELYLNYLHRYERRSDENTPIGLILCTGKNTEHIELMQLEKSNIRVAEYFTVLPSKAKLKAKLHKAIIIAQRQLAAVEEEK